MPQASELIVQFLHEAGIDAVFGIPGGGTGQIFTHLAGKEPAINTYLARHEQTAAIMADAYARAAGKPAVIMGQGLFMGSNAAFGIMEAMLSSSPMLVLTDTSDGGVGQHPANQSGAGEYGSIDLHNIFRVNDQVHYPGHLAQGGRPRRPAGHQAFAQRTPRPRLPADAHRRHRGRGRPGNAALYPRHRRLSEHRQAPGRAPGH